MARSLRDLLLARSPAVPAAPQQPAPPTDAQIDEQNAAAYRQNLAQSSPFVSGLKEGTTNLEGSVEALAGLGQGAIGDVQGGRSRLRRAATTLQQAQDYSTPETADLATAYKSGNLMRYAEHQLGSLTPGIAATVIPAVVTGGAGAAVQGGLRRLALGAAEDVAGGVAKKAAQNTLGRVIGEQVGAIGSGAAQMAGTTAGAVDPNASDEQFQAQSRKALAGAAGLGVLQAIPGVALLHRYGVGAGAEAAIAKRLGAPLYQRLLREGGEQAALGGATGAALVKAEHATHDWITGHPSAAPALPEYINALAAGSLGGAVFGAPAGLKGAPREGFAKRASKLRADLEQRFKDVQAKRVKPGEEIPLDGGKSAAEHFDDNLTALRDDETPLGGTAFNVSKDNILNGPAASLVDPARTKARATYYKALGLNTPTEHAVASMLNDAQFSGTTAAMLNDAPKSADALPGIKATAKAIREGWGNLNEKERNAVSDFAGRLDAGQRKLFANALTTADDITSRSGYAGRKDASEIPAFRKQYMTDENGQPLLRTDENGKQVKIPVSEDVGTGNKRTKASGLSDEVADPIADPGASDRAGLATQEKDAPLGYVDPETWAGAQYFKKRGGPARGTPDEENVRMVRFNKDGESYSVDFNMKQAASSLAKSEEGRALLGSQGGPSRRVKAVMGVLTEAIDRGMPIHRGDIREGLRVFPGEDGVLNAKEAAYVQKAMAKRYEGTPGVIETKGRANPKSTLDLPQTDEVATAEGDLAAHQDDQYKLGPDPKKVAGEERAIETTARRAAEAAGVPTRINGRTRPPADIYEHLLRRAKDSKERGIAMSAIRRLSETDPALAERISEAHDKLDAFNARQKAREGTKPKETLKTYESEVPIAEKYATSPPKDFTAADARKRAERMDHIYAKAKAKAAELGTEHPAYERLDSLMADAKNAADALRHVAEQQEAAEKHSPEQYKADENIPSKLLSREEEDPRGSAALRKASDEHIASAKDFLDSAQAEHDRAQRAAPNGALKKTIDSLLRMPDDVAEETEAYQQMSPFERRAYHAARDGGEELHNAKRVHEAALAERKTLEAELKRPRAGNDSDGNEMPTIRPRFDQDLYTNNASGESSASVEAINRLRDEKAAGQSRMLVDRDGSVRPLLGVDAVDTFARPGQIIVQRGVGKEPWTIISDGTGSKDLAQGKLNAARRALEAEHADLMSDAADKDVPKAGKAVDLKELTAEAERIDRDGRLMELMRKDRLTETETQEMFGLARQHNPAEMKTLKAWRDAADAADNERRTAAVAIARDLGIKDPEKFVKLSEAVSRAQKDNSEVTRDPVTGKKFTGTELMDQLESEGKDRLGDEFSRRRGYTKAEIAQYHEYQRVLREAIDKVGAADAEYVEGVASGQLDIPAQFRAGGKTIRLYRGESEQNTKGGDWFTRNREQAEKFGQLHYIDVTPEELGKHFAQGHNFKEGVREEYVMGSNALKDRVKPLGNDTPPIQRAIEKVKASKGYQQVAKLVEHVVRAGNDRVKERQLVNRLSKAFGVDALPVVEHHGGPAGKYDGKTISLRSDLKGAQRLSTMFHEFGHHLVESKWAGADEKTKAALEADYQSWLKANAKKTNSFEVRASRAPFFVNERILDALGGERAASMKELPADKVSYLLSRDEYFADSIARALEQHEGVQGLVGKFFAKLAQTLKLTYDLLRGTDPKLADTPAAVKEWVHSLWSAQDPDLAAPAAKRDAPELRTAAGEAPRPAFNTPSDTSTLLSPEDRGVLASFMLRKGTMAQLLEGASPEMARRLLNFGTQLDAAVNRGFALWATGKLKLVDKRTLAVLHELRDVVKKTFGFVTDKQVAERVLADLKAGRYDPKESTRRVLENEVRAGFRARIKEGDTNAKIEMAIHKAVTKTTHLVHDKLAPVYDRVFNDLDHRIRATHIPALRQLADIVHRQTGERGEGETLTQSITRNRAKLWDRATKLTEGLSLRDQAKLVKALRTKAKLDGPLEKRRQAIAAFMGDMHHYLEMAGVEVGHIKDYWPVAVDPRKIQNREADFRALLSDPKLEAGMRDYFKSKDWDVTKMTQKDMVDAMYRMAASEFDYSQNGISFADGLVPGGREFRTRVSEFIYRTGDEALINKFAKFQSGNLEQTLIPYITHAVRRAESTRRLGAMKDDVGGSPLEQLLDKAKTQGAGEEQIQLAKDYINAALGSYGTGPNPFFQKALGAFDRVFDTKLGDMNSAQYRKLSNAIIAYQNLRVLGLGLFGNLVDPMGVWVRSSSAGQTWTGYKAAMKAAFAKGDTHLADMAHVVGTVERHALGEALAYNYGGSGDDLNSLSMRINRALFRVNGMESITRFARLAATETANKFLLRHANDPTTHSARYLDELGLKPSDIKEDPEHPGYVKLTTKVEKAIYQFVDESVLRPVATQRPLWHNDPHFAVLAQYKGYLYSFYNTVVQRMLHEAHNGNFRGLMPIVGYMGVTMAAELLREMVQYGPGGNPRRKDWDAADYLALSADRSGLLGPKLGILEDSLTDVERGNIPGQSITGPAVSQAGELLKTVAGRRSFDSTAVHALPGQSIYKGWLSHGDTAGVPATGADARAAAGT